MADIVYFDICTQEPSLKDPNEDYIFEDMEVMSDFELHKLCLQYKVRPLYLVTLLSLA